MNKDINIILNSTDVVAGAVTAVDGVISLLKNAGADSVFKFRWAKVQSAPTTLGVDEVAAIQRARVDSATAGDEYSFILTQKIGEESITERIAYTASSGDTIATIAAGLKAIVDAHISAGRFSASTAIATDVVTDDTVVITSVAGSPLMTVSNSSLAVTLNATSTDGVAAVNAGADLAAEGIKDSFDAELPTSGVKYTLVDWNLMLPKGHGGFNHQTDDQLVSLKLYVQDDATAYADLLGPTGDLTYILRGLNPSGTGSDELLGQMPV